MKFGGNRKAEAPLPKGLAVGVVVTQPAREEDKAAAALQILFDLSATRAHRLIGLVDALPGAPISIAIKDLFFCKPGKLAKSTAALESAVLEFEGWLEKVSESDDFKLVAAETLPEKLIRKTLIEAGAQFQDFSNSSFDDQDSPPYQKANEFDETRLADSLISFEGEFFLTDKLSDVVRDYRAHRDLGSNPLRELLKGLKQVQEQVPPVLARRYLNDFIAQYGTLESYVKQDDFEAKVRRLAFAGVVNNYVHEAHELLAKTRQTYQEIGRLRASGLMALVPEDASNFRDLPLRVVRAARKFDGDREISNATRLLRGADDGQRLELLDLLASNKQHLRLGVALRKVQVADREFAEFLLSTSHLQMGGDSGCTLLEAAYSLPANPGMLSNTAFLVRNGSRLASDENWPIIESFLRTHESAYILVSHYLDCSEAGEANKARAFIRLIDENLTAAELKVVKQHMGSLEDGDLDWIISANADLPVFRKILRTSSSHEGTTTRNQRSSKRKGWISLMRADLVKRGVLKEPQAGKLATSVASLPEIARIRLRNLWRTQPGSMGTFARHLETYRANSDFTLILKDTELFENYKGALRDQKEKTIEAILDHEHGNAYWHLREWLCEGKGQLSDEQVEAEALVPEASLANVPAGNYRRIIIWGGQYPGEKRPKIIKSARKLKIELYDLHSPRHADIEVGRNDLFIWVTTSNDHDGTCYRMRKKCRNNKAGYFRFRQSGYKPLVELVRAIDAASGSVN